MAGSSGKESRVVEKEKHYQTLLPGPGIAPRLTLGTSPPAIWKWIVVLAFSSSLLFWNFLKDDISSLHWLALHSPKNVILDDDVLHWSFRAFATKRMNASEAEKLFLSIPSEQGAINTSADFAGVPHLGGSTEDFEQAQALLKIFQTQLNISAPSSVPIYDAGSIESRMATLSLVNITSPTAWIDTYYPVLNTPLERELQILNDDGSAAWNADVEEQDIGGDPAGKYAKTIGAWHGLSAAGNVKGPLIYVNYGSKPDYDELASKGVSLKGAIAIARYGGLFRGLKVKGAQEAGAIGCIIYGDPRDDGTVTPEHGYATYPEGPARNPTSVQRGSVQFLSMYPGDPTTPGFPSYPNVTRQEGLNKPAIPSLPISWQNAKVLLREISPSFNYTLDGAKSKRNIRLHNEVETKVTPIWNTMAVIPGYFKQEIVLMGCHRDAWVMGGADPVSGTAAIVEIVKGFSALMKQGWRPLRTIVIASWDAEEPGLVGSTEYGEDFSTFLQEHVVAYINVDVATGGSRFKLGGSPSLAHLLRRTAIEIPHPTDANRTLWDARHDVGKLNGNYGVADTQSGLTPLDDLDNLSIDVRPLGSGSDYTVFLQHLGIASSDEGFGGTLSDPVYHYHSVYDSHTWQMRYGDPGFHRHVVIAKHMGLTILRLIDTPLLPLNTTQYALELHNYCDKVVQSAEANHLPVSFGHLRSAINEVQKASDKLDHTKVKAARRLEKAISALGTTATPDWSPDTSPHSPQRCKHNAVSSGMRRWVKSIFGVQSGMVGHHCKYPKQICRVMDAAAEVIKINSKLAGFERGFISPEGIKDREWYKNLAVAPGKWTGYGATTFPALDEAIRIEKNLTLANDEVERLSGLISRLAQSLH